MHPVFRKFPVVGRFRLGDLILMMREDQVFTARVDINLISQIPFAHDRALDMPARTSFTPGRFPERLPFLLRLPQHEIQRILLLLLAGHQQGTAAAAQIVQILVREFTILAKTPGLKIHRAVLPHIGMILVDQRLDHLDHAPDLLRRLRMRGGRLHVQGLHVLSALLDIALGDHGRIHPFLIRLLDDLIIHIGKIGNIVDRISLMFHVTSGRVKNDHRPRIPDMNQVIHRRPAHIHADLPFHQGYEFLFLSG